MDAGADVCSAVIRYRCQPYVKPPPGNPLVISSIADAYEEAARYFAQVKWDRVREDQMKL